MISLSIDKNPISSGLSLAQKLLHLHPEDRDRATYPGCSQAGAESCVKTDIDLKLLKTSDSVEMPGGVHLKLSRRTNTSAVFMAEGAEALFAWRDEHIAGQLSTQGTVWSLEGCGDKCFLWIRQQGNWVDEGEEIMDSRLVVKPSLEYEALQVKLDKENMSTLSAKAKGIGDTRTVITYSVMIWYTPQFRNLFSSDSDMLAHVELIIDTTNQGYINSQMPVSCYIIVTIHVYSL